MTTLGTFKLHKEQTADFQELSFSPSRIRCDSGGARKSTSYLQRPCEHFR
jgi:hypothetical protein